ncbi:MAG: hypothetical protein IV092_04880 [Burkholderiaceae bacterium]|nr:hypothetical protein [Burkholderiaceae bacterium]
MNRRLALALLLATPALARAQALVSNAEGLRLSSQGQQLILSGVDGTELRRWPVADVRGRRTTVQALRDASARRSFIVVLSGLAELWEIAYDPSAAPVYEGLVHDYRMGEGIASPGYLTPRRMPLDAPIGAIFFDPRMPWLLAEQGGQLVVLHLDVRRRIASLGAADIGSARLLQREGQWLLSLDRGEGQVLFDTRRWQPVQAVSAY